MKQEDKLTELWTEISSEMKPYVKKLLKIRDKISSLYEDRDKLYQDIIQRQKEIVSRLLIGKFIRLNENDDYDKYLYIMAVNVNNCVGHVIDNETRISLECHEIFLRNVSRLNLRYNGDNVFLSISDYNNYNNYNHDYNFNLDIPTDKQYSIADSSEMNKRIDDILKWIDEHLTDDCIYEENAEIYWCCLKNHCYKVNDGMHLWLKLYPRRHGFDNHYLLEMSLEKLYDSGIKYSKPMSIEKFSEIYGKAKDKVREYVSGLKTDANEKSDIK